MIRLPINRNLAVKSMVLPANCDMAQHLQAVLFHVIDMGLTEPFAPASHQCGTRR